VLLDGSGFGNLEILGRECDGVEEGDGEREIGGEVLVSA